MNPTRHHLMQNAHLATALGLGTPRLHTANRQRRIEYAMLPLLLAGRCRDPKIAFAHAPLPNPATRHSTVCDQRGNSAAVMQMDAYRVLALIIFGVLLGGHQSPSSQRRHGWLEHTHTGCVQIDEPREDQSMHR